MVCNKEMRLIGMSCGDYRKKCLVLEDLLAWEHFRRRQKNTAGRL